MALELPAGASVYPGEVERIQAALDLLAKDPHAPRELDIKVVIHIHHEYPKHITVGKNDLIVNSAEEEAAAEGVAGYGLHRR